MFIMCQTNWYAYDEIWNSLFSDILHIMPNITSEGCNRKERKYIGRKFENMLEECKSYYVVFDGKNGL